MLSRRQVPEELSPEGARKARVRDDSRIGERLDDLDWTVFGVKAPGFTARASRGSADTVWGGEDAKTIKKPAALQSAR
jgi:hypothetical protein